MTQKITGKIRHIFNGEIAGETLYKKRFVVDYVSNAAAKWNKSSPVQFFAFNRKNNNANIYNELDLFSNGDEVEIEFKILGREFLGKYFNTLECVGIKLSQTCKEI